VLFRSKKDLGLLMMAYGTVYVAKVAMGANPAQAVKAFAEAEAYPGPSLIMAYSHCINHGYNMRYGMNQQKLAVNAGVWPIYRYDPTLKEEGKNPLKLDYKEPSIPVKEFAYNETRFKMLVQSNEERAEELMKHAEKDALSRWQLYSQMAAMDYSQPTAE